MLHLPPRGRRGSAAVLLAVAIHLLLLAPAAAAGGLSLTPLQRTVTGSSLTLAVAGGDAQGRVTLVLTDAGGSQAIYRFSAGAAADGRALSLDVSAPDGAAPRNGRATVTLSDSTGTLAQTQVTVDRTPSAPSLSAIVEGRRVRVTWSRAAAADPVTYRVERSAGGAAQVVYEGQSTAFTDGDLSPGRVTYALTAGVPGAGGGTNWSAPATTSAKIVASTSPAAPTSADAGPGAAAVHAQETTKASRASSARRQAARPARRQQRLMAASGAVRPMGDTTSAVQTVGYASAPWFDASAVPHVVAASPRVAAPRASYSDRFPNPFPTRALAAAPLAARVAGRAPSLIVPAAAALVLLALAAAALRRWSRDRRELQRLVLALARVE